MTNLSLNKNKIKNGKKCRTKLEMIESMVQKLRVDLSKRDSRKTRKWKVGLRSMELKKRRIWLANIWKQRRRLQNLRRRHRMLWLKRILSSITSFRNKFPFLRKKPENKNIWSTTSKSLRKMRRKISGISKKKHTNFMTKTLKSSTKKNTSEKSKEKSKESGKLQSMEILNFSSKTIHKKLRLLQRKPPDRFMRMTQLNNFSQLQFSCRLLLFY